MPTDGVFDEAVETYVRTHLDSLHADLDAWLRIPSVSADPLRSADVRTGANWLATALRRTGFPTVELLDTPGHPAVYAEWPAEDRGAPVVLLYGHHDVQPADPVRSCSPAGPSTTKASCCSTCSGCAPTWPRPAGPPLRCT